MIEFKGECGHIIRAHDGDEGKTVRCSYCGQEAIVVSPMGDETDALFDEVERTGAFDAHSTRAARKGARKKQQAEARAGKPAPELDPFDVAMKMVFVAVLIVAVAVAWKYGTAAYKSVRQNIEEQDATKPGRVADATPAPTPAAPRVGLVAARLNAQQSGAYVASVPSGGDVFHLPDWGHGSDLFDDKLADKHLQTNVELRLAPGKHTVAVALRINDPALMQVPGYPEFRRKIESREYDEARQMELFFVPDGSEDLHLFKEAGLWHIARVYEIEVESQLWLAVTAMFLPRANLGSLMSVLPNTEQYKFDVSMVTGELVYYQVPEADRSDVIAALHRVGKVCYQRNEEEPFRLFQIDPLEGILISENLGF